MSLSTYISLIKIKYWEKNNSHFVCSFNTLSLLKNNFFCFTFSDRDREGRESLRDHSTKAPFTAEGLPHIVQVSCWATEVRTHCCRERRGKTCQADPPAEQFQPSPRTPTVDSFKTLSLLFTLSWATLKVVQCSCVCFRKLLHNEPSPPVLTDFTLMASQRRQTNL